MVVVRLAEDGIEEPVQVLLQSWSVCVGGVEEPEEEVGDEGIHLGVHVEHAVEVVHSKVEHPDEAVVNDGRSILEYAVRLRVLQ